MPCDYSKYPPNWKTEIVPAIRKRSGGKCEVCGVDNYSVGYWENNGFYSLSTPPHEVVWMNEKSQYKQAREIQKHINEWCDNPEAIVIVLTVAHLDHDEENHNVKLDRLKDMCQRCHNRYDRKHRNETRKKKKLKGQITLKLSFKLNLKHLLKIYRRMAMKLK